MSVRTLLMAAAVGGGRKVTWNPADQSGLTFSNANLTVTANGAACGARANTSLAPGKWYWEGTFNYSGARTLSLGIGKSTANLAASIAGVANTTVVSELGMYFVDTANPGSGANATHNGSVICCAYDATANRMWLKIDVEDWNASSTADPATGVGGFAPSAGTYFPIVGLFNTGHSVTANFGATAFAYPVPSGFTSLGS